MAALLRLMYYHDLILILVNLGHADTILIVVCFSLVQGTSEMSQPLFATGQMFLSGIFVL